MTDLDSTIRAALDDIVRTAPDPAPSPLRSVSEPSRARRLPAITIGSALVVATALAGLVFVVTRPADETDSPAATAASTESSGPTVNVPSPMDSLIPSSLPTGYRVQQAYTSPAAAADPTRQLYVIAQRLPNGEIGPSIDVVSDDSTSIFSQDGEITFEREPVTLANGVEAQMLWWGSQNDRLSLEYLDPTGRAVVISTKAIDRDPAAAQRLITTANGIAVIDLDASVLGPLPDGYEVVASTPELIGGGPTSTLVLSDGSQPGRSITLSLALQPPSGFPFNAGMSDGFQPLTVRGKSGYTSTHLYSDCDCPTTTMTWLERPDLQVTVTGDAVPLDDLRAFAESLEPAQTSAWDALANTAAQPPG
jgi:hypothetical protein